MTGTTYGYTSTFKSNCSHYNAIRVCSFTGGGSLWAGSRLELLEVGNFALVVSAVGFTDFAKNPISCNEQARKLLPEALISWSPPPCIGIEWADRGVPALPPEWWDVLAIAIAKIEGKVGLCCMGGHGRTGTMLAILGTLTGMVGKKQCPVKWARKNYCKEAVESNAQVEYIEYVTGRTVKAPPSDEVTASKLTGGKSVDPTKASSPSQVATALPSQGTGTGAGGAGGGGTSFRSSPALPPLGEPTDLELERALEDGGDGAAEPSGYSGRWLPVYGEEGEIIGWCEE